MIEILITLLVLSNSSEMDMEPLRTDVQGRSDMSEQHMEHPEREPIDRATSPVWDRLAECESHGEWDYGPHSDWGSHLFEGGLQFHPDTWDGFKPTGYPEAAYQATKQQQILVAEEVLATQGWKAWPACSRKLGLR